MIRFTIRMVRGLLPVAAILLLHANVGAQTPVTGHYPPGQSGIRGAGAAKPGWAYTNFSRLFSNLVVRDAEGETVSEPDEVRYANISMFTWTTNHRLLGMRYGAMAGIPFSTGNLNPSSSDVGSKAFGLGDVLLTPVALYGEGSHFDHTLQFTMWSSSGRFSPGSSNNRGAGFWSLVYSAGGVWYPSGDRASWSVSALARLEQNFEQSETGVKPGDDLVVDWGVGKVLARGAHPIDAGISGFAAWQLNEQEGGVPLPDASRYRIYGIGPEGSMGLDAHWTLRLRAHWELEAENVVQGNNLWFIVNYRN